MFRRSKWKIIFAIMASVLLIFASTMGAILVWAYFENRAESREMLDRFVNSFIIADERPELRPSGNTFDKPQGEEPPEIRDNEGEEPGGRKRGMEARRMDLSVFYSVVFSKDGELESVNSEGGDFFTEAELVEKARAVLSSGRESGTVDSLCYRVLTRETYTLVAFHDNALSDERMASMIRMTLIVGGAAFLILFLIAFLVAHRIVKPLEENDEKQKQFVSDAGHELKTPVSVVSANLAVLKREIGDNEWLDNIRYENERMGDLVTQLLDLSRAENAAVPMEELDFSRLVEGEALPFESLAFERGLSIRSAIAENIHLRGNRSQLAQLSSILLENAIRHSSGGQEIGLTLKREGRHALLSVENCGEAIPEEQRKRLFERFYRVDEARTGADHHYGLGLSIARAITERHGGSISVACPAGKVVFTVQLPC